MAKEVQHTITGEHFYRFFQCPHWIWYDLYEDAQKRQHRPPLLDMVFRDGLRQKGKAVSGREFEHIPAELYDDLDEAFLATLELMKQGKNVYRGVLMDKHWVGMPDLIEKRPGKSNFGDYYYVAYDIKTAHLIRDEHIFPLVFYSLILEKIQGVMPETAYIIDGDGHEREISVAKFLDKFHLALDTIEKILQGEKPAPFLKTGCKKSPWYSLCMDETQACDDVSLVHGVNQIDQRTLYDIGVKSVEDLAKRDLDRIYSEIENWSYDKVSWLHLQARALHEHAHKVLQKPVFPNVDTELYFDVESDPTQGLHYLFGVLMKQSTKTVYNYWFANDASKERKNWENFLKFVESFNSPVIYHFGYYERYVLNKMQERYETDLERVAKIKDNMIDISRTVYDSVILPLYFYGLKDVAGYIGYKWKNENMGGAESVLLFDQWQKDQQKNVKDTLLQYNEDDTRATLAIREWLATLKPEKPVREEAKT